MIARLLRRPTSDDRDAEQAINDFQSDIAEITGGRPPMGARITVILVGGMIVLALVAASVAQLDRVVTARGRVVPQTPTIVVQPLETAIIRQIEVRPGDIVRAGQTLVVLDPTILAADVTQQERRAASLQAEIARLEAEAAGQRFEAAGDDPYMILQAVIWRHRQAEYASRIATFNQRISSAEAVIARTREDVTHFRSRLALLSEIETMRMTLEKNQVGSRLAALEASDGRLEVSRNLASSEGQIRSASFELAALRSEREVFEEEWRSELVKLLVDRRGENDTVREELNKARLRRGLVELRAVADAVVLEMSSVSVGSVVESAERIFTLVPLNAPLEVEANISGDDQGFVKPGDLVRIKLDAYPFIRHGTAGGRTRIISEDSFTEGENNSSSGTWYFRAHIDINDLSTLRGLPDDFRLIPGMPLTADIVVGQRSVISYLLSRFQEASEEGMREP